MDTSKPVAEIMTRKLVVLSEEDNLEHIDEIMDRHGFRHLPVVDGGKLVGLVSQRDMLSVESSTQDSMHHAIDQKMKSETFVADIMTRDLVTVRPDTPVVEAAQVLLSGKFGCLPVVEEDDTLVGIVTQHDFVQLLVKVMGGEIDDDGVNGNGNGHDDAPAGGGDEGPAAP